VEERNYNFYSRATENIPHKIKMAIYYTFNRTANKRKVYLVPQGTFFISSVCKVVCKHERKRLASSTKYSRTSKIHPCYRSQITLS